MMPGNQKPSWTLFAIETILTGPCYLLQIISGTLKDQITINFVEDNLLKAGDLLKEINPQRQSCLRTFTECVELVTWLRLIAKGKGLRFFTYLLIPKEAVGYWPRCRKGTYCIYTYSSCDAGKEISHALYMHGHRCLSLFY